MPVRNMWGRGGEVYSIIRIERSWLFIKALVFRKQKRCIHFHKIVSCTTPLTSGDATADWLVLSFCLSMSSLAWWSCCSRAATSSALRCCSSCYTYQSYTIVTLPSFLVLSFTCKKLVSCCSCCDCSLCFVNWNCSSSSCCCSNCCCFI